MPLRPMWKGLLNTLCFNTANNNNNNDDDDDNNNNNYNRVLKCDVTRILIFEITGFVSIFGKTMMKNAYLPKISILFQIGGEILVLLCPGDSI